MSDLTDGDAAMDGVMFQYSSLTFTPNSATPQSQSASVNGLIVNHEHEDGRTGPKLQVPEQSLEHIIDNIFLPSKLPQDGDGNSPSRELDLLLFIREAITQFSTSELATVIPGISHIHEMIVWMVKCHRGSGLERESLTRGLQYVASTDGAILPLYLFSQNAGIVVRRKAQDILFETFEVSPPNESVMGCQGRLLCSYPGPSVAIPRAILQDRTFLHELTSYLEAMSEQIPNDRISPMTSKAKSKVTEIRDTHLPVYVTEFLTGLLRGLGKPAETTPLCKRIADEVLWSDARIPWRRSPYWLVFRVALQTTLFQPLRAPPDQNTEYKLLMLYIIATALETAAVTGHISSDKLSHMCRKLSRRAAKLDNKIPSGLLQIVNQAVYRATGILGTRFLGIQGCFSVHLAWSPAQLNLLDDTNLTMRNSRGYIEYMLEQYKHSDTLNSSTGMIPKHRLRIPHSQFTTTLPGTSFLDDSERGIALMDMEWWIENFLGSFVSSNIHRENACIELLHLMKTYARVAAAEYAKDPINHSLMILTITELWVALDLIAVSTCPLLKDYSCEIDTEILSVLLLPTESLLRRLRKIEEYIESRKAQASLGTIYQDARHISSNSFGVRYYNRSHEHQVLLTEITKAAEDRRREKQAEYRRLKEECDDLLRRSNSMSCGCSYHTYSNGRHGYWITCTRCSLRKQAENMTISVHEWPLPSRSDESKALVVEMRLPVAFAAWRDATYNLVVNTFNPSLPTDSSCTFTSHEVLRGYSGLSSYFRDVSQDISWFSETKSFTRAHYSTRHIINLTSETDYLVPNGLKYRVSMSSTADKSPSIVKMLECAKNKETAITRKLCTLVLPESSSALQFALDSTFHTPNFSIAHQYLCPKEWSIHEYDSFTTLRSGFRLQWLNILREIRAGNLNLNRFESQLLFMQAAWQAGPGSLNSVTRESHIKLTEEEFCVLILEALQDSLDVLKENWLEQVAMQTHIVLGARVLSSTSLVGVKNKAVIFLRNCRKACMDWMHDVLARTHVTDSDESLQKWQSLALTIAATARLTFNADTGDIERLLNSVDDVSDFIEAAVCIHHNTPPNTQGHKFRLLLARDDRLAHKMEPRLRDIFHGKPDWLDSAILRIWPEYRPETRGAWTTLPESNNRWITTIIGGSGSGTRMTIHYNLLNGALLVNGMPFGRLPQEYIQSATYRRLFQNRIFLVTRAVAVGMEFQMVHPIYELGDSKVFLDFAMRKGELVIRARQGKEAYELIPHHKLQNDFPISMIEPFTHFLDLKNGTLEFRPLGDGKSIWLPSPTNWVIQITTSASSNSWRAQGQRTLSAGNSKLIDYRSATYRALSKVFRSIESASYLEVTLSNPSQVNITLPRYTLEFYVDTTPESSRHIFSRNFPGMAVDTRPNVGQDIGTLYGLKNYLVLREENTSWSTATRSVLIPHGDVKTHYVEDGHQHPSVNIDTSDLPTVPYHMYTIDTLLGGLSTNGSLKSKLYKIYLHAVTSYCLPDPLTGLTGTEQALDDLRSASSWCFQKLEESGALGPSEMDLLVMIAGLTPTRKFYPSQLMSMQQVKWLQFPPYVQHEEFQSVVESILRYWTEISSFQLLGSGAQCPQFKNSPHLHKRAYIRAAAYLPAEYGGRNDLRSHDKKYEGRAITQPELEARVCRTASLVQGWTKSRQPVTDLSSILKRWDLIPTGNHKRLALGYEHGWHLSSFRLGEYWYSLYNSLRGCSRTNDLYKVLFMMCSLSYRGEADVPKDLVETLIAFATTSSFRHIDPPTIPHTKDCYNLGIGSEPSRHTIRSILENYTVSFEDSPQYKLSQNSHETSTDHWNRRKSQYADRLKNDLDNATNYYMGQRDWSSVSRPAQTTYPLLRSPGHDGVDEKFVHWYHNKNYLQHLSTVQGALNTMKRESACTTSIATFGNATYHRCFSPQPEIKITQGMQTLLETKPIPMVPHRSSRPPLDVSHIDAPPAGNEHIIRFADPLEPLLERLSIEASGFQNQYHSDLHASWNALKDEETKSSQASQITLPDITKMQSYQKECSRVLWTTLGEIINALRPVEGTTEALLYHTGLRPRTTTRTLLSQLTLSHLLGEKWRQTLLSFGEALSIYQQAMRLYHHVDNRDAAGFGGEWSNKGRMDWSAAEYPEWLLFEIENNILIRPVQAEIASEMLAQGSNRNTVMQLNMGEGKSSVIVPIVAAALANKKRLVRVIVLKPLSGQMFHLLVQKLSGLLNRRIYYLPFSRQVTLDSTKVTLIQRLYEECMNNGGILLCQPEHILSYKLVGIEQLCKSSQLAQALVQSQRWLEEHTRDILDESDELLHVRYQLIYTLEPQHQPELSPDRWIVMQEILSLVAKHMRQLKKRYHDAVEFIVQDPPQPIDRAHVPALEEYPGSFPFTRLLKKEAEEELIRTIAVDIIERGVLGAVSTRWFTTRKSELALKYITTRQMTPEEMEELGQILPHLVLIRGLIAHNILAFVLREKRWRVDYGLAPYRSMLAVPYRAKDSPAPRAEFGHPDVTIALTCLSYYYQGLDEEQLRSCFERLSNIDNPAQEYLFWVADCTDDLPSSLWQLNGINLEDDDQWKKKVYPLLRLNKRVIDFYLASTVFPKACKEFEKKLTTSGWDLAEKKRFPTTGFSGTNDNKYLLPVSIEQLDLSRQRHTNAKVLKYLLQPENNFYRCAKTPGDERLKVNELLELIFEAGSEQQVQVLLDAGAQVLEMTNQEVAACWLDLAKKRNQPWTAAVFFNEDDELNVISKDGSIQPYMISPYVKNMDKCLVYLDESHTRGTDLKLPRHSIAAVTLGPKLTKDRLVQACMRMRRLGHGQSVRFFAPPEVHHKLLEQSRKYNLNPDAIGTMDVIQWVIHETCIQTQRGFAMWAHQGLGYQVRQDAWEKYKDSHDEQALAKAWKERESLTLEELYGMSSSDKHSINTIITEKLCDSSLKSRHKQLETIQRCCTEFKVMSLQEVAAQEEQEREVANEVEREQQVERPKPAPPAAHQVHWAVRDFVKTGNIASGSDAFMPIIETLTSTKFSGDISTQPWASNLMATKDFSHTIQLTAQDSKTTDDYLRPVTWIVSRTRNAGQPPVLCLLSAYEVNELLPVIQQSKWVNIHMYSPKVQRVHATFEDLTYAAIPALPQGWGFPAQAELMAQVNLFSGQLFFKNHEAYVIACGFLGIYLRDERHPADKLPPGVEVDGFLPNWRVRAGASEVLNREVAFKKSPIEFLRNLLAARRKGMKFDTSHMGLLVHAKELGNEHFT